MAQLWEEHFPSKERDDRQEAEWKSHLLLKEEQQHAKPAKGSNQVRCVLQVWFMFRHLTGNRETEAFKGVDQCLGDFEEHLGV